MVTSGPPFYDPDEWDPDGPTIEETLGLNTLHKWMGGILLSPWQLKLLSELMQQEHGRAWKAPFQAFIDELAPTFEEVNRTLKAMAPVEKIVNPKPPKNGPKFDPHARRGKGGRRR